MNRILIIIFGVLHLLAGGMSQVQADSTTNIVSIQNEQILVRIKLLGAELNSIYSKRNDLEYLWQGSEESWKKQAPILFPIAGRLKPEEIRIDGRPCSIPQHGFARDQTFELLEQSKTRVLLQLRDNPDTRAIFPRTFILQVVYGLSANHLSIAYQVKNPGKKSLPFILGSHPGFNCPLEPSLSFSDYYLQFDQPENATRIKFRGGVISEELPNYTQGKTRMVLYPDGLKGAIFLKELQSKTVTLKSDRSPREVRVQINNFPLVGFWTKNPQAGFFCIEPWQNPLASPGFHGEFSERPGVINLPPGQSWSSDLAISIK